MRFQTKIKTALELYKMRSFITPAIYQRGEVWSDDKKKLLIDSILRGIDIPKLYFFNVGDGTFEIVDGNQRMGTIVGFFDEEFTDLEGRTFQELTDSEKNIVEKHEFTVIEITQADEADLSDLFLRLQLGVPTNSGEKLNAIKSNMREFVKKLAEIEFMKNVSMPKRRFAKEQVCAQICRNSINQFMVKGFKDAKFEDLKEMYKSNYDFSEKSNEAKRILETFSMLNKIFGKDAVEIRNRAGIVSIYFFVEESLLDGSLDKESIKRFYIQFLGELKDEVGKGIDAEKRSLVTYYNKVVQGADSGSAIAFRHYALKQFFEEYMRTGTIISEFKKKIEF